MHIAHQPKIDTHKDLWIEANNIFKGMLLKMDCITSTLFFLINPLLFEVQSFKYYCYYQECLENNQFLLPPPASFLLILRFLSSFHLQNPFKEINYGLVASQKCQSC